MVKIILLFGTYFMFEKCRWMLLKPLCWIWRSLKSIGNANKVLKHDMSDAKKQDYVVIYGVTNKGGLAFANFLAKRGFSIILIDKEKEKLE